MSIEGQRYMISQEIKRSWESSAIQTSDAELLYLFLESKSCPLGTPSGRFNQETLSLNQVQQLLRAIRRCRNPQWIEEFAKSDPPPLGEHVADHKRKFVKY
jgi:hypothetical protein